MYNFKKAIKATLAFVLCFIISSTIIIFPCMQNGSDYNDSAARQELRGNIDYIFNGASHAYGAFYPAIIDEELGVCSWNLSSSSASLQGRKTILEKELQRNLVDTVVIDVSFDTLSRCQSEEHATGEPMIICKLDNNVERMRYFFENVSFWNSDYENVLSVFMRYGLKAWKSKMLGEFGQVQSNKGFMPAESIDLKLSEAEIVSQYNSAKRVLPFREENVEILKSTITMCQQYGARVIIAVVPISDVSIWKKENLDDFWRDLSTICEESDCLLYDFNLIKTRYETYSDVYSFADETHMSEDGAITFSKNFADIIQRLNAGEDVRHLFYASYDEMKQNSPYMEDYLQLVGGTDK